jgi:protoporphyrinogen oxidase
MKKTAAIIGGGITGLSLAYFLLKKGIKVTVFEKEDHLGGLVSTFKIGNVCLEKFYHHFFSQDQFALQLLEELGIKDKFFWVHPGMGFFSQGKLYPFTTPLDLLRFRPLSLLGRVKLGLFGLKVKKERDGRDLEDRTAGDWLEDNLGENVYQKVWKPLLRAKFGDHFSGVSAAWVWARLRARSRSRGRFSIREKLGYLKGSYQTLLDALAKKIREQGGEIKLNSGTVALPLPGFDLTVVTTPNAFPVPAIKYLGNLCVVLKLKRTFGKFYWVNIADPEIPFCGMVEHTNAFDDPGFGGYKILYLSNYLDHGDPLWQAPDQEVFAKCFAGLEKIKPGFSSEDMVEYHVFREKYAQPLPAIEYSKKVPPFKVGEKLYLVSNMQIYPEDRGVNNSIKLAWEFVEQLS